VTTEIEGEPECWGRVCVQLKVIVVVVVVDVRGGGGRPRCYRRWVRGHADVITHTPEILQSLVDLSLCTE